MLIQHVVRNDYSASTNDDGFAVIFDCFVLCFNPISMLLLTPSSYLKVLCGTYMLTFQTELCKEEELQ